MQGNDSSSIPTLDCPITLVLGTSDVHQRSFVICLGILCPLTVISNCLLIFALRKTKQLNTYSNKMITAMSSCDLIMGLILQPALIVMFFMKRSMTICYFIVFITLGATIMLHTSALLSVLISIDRYLQVTKLKRYSVYMNASRMKVSIGLCFVLGACMSFFYALHRSFDTRTLITVVSISLLLFVCILYSVILRKLQNHLDGNSTRTRRAGENANPVAIQNQADSSLNSRSHLSAIKTLRVLQVTMLILYSPYLIITILRNCYSLHLRISPPQMWNEALIWSIIIVECNAWVNAWILIHGNSRCRRYLISMIRDSFRRFWNRNHIAALTVGERQQEQIEEVKL